jgi:mutator protein MutT
MLSVRPFQTIDVGVGIVVIGQGAGLRILACQRRAGDYWGGWWEFPGGKCEPGEQIDACIVRELREELEIDVAVQTELPVVEHLYSDRNRLVRLHPRICRLAPTSGAGRAVEVQAFRWCAPVELLDLRFLPANTPLLRALGQHLGHPELANAPETTRVTSEREGV